MGNAPGSKTDTFDAFSKTLTGVLVGIKANLTATRTLPMGGATVSVAKVSSDFQSFIDNNTAVDKAKVDLKAQVEARKAQREAVKVELADFTKWAVLQFGNAAYNMFGLKPPKAHKVSPSKAALGAAKRKAKADAKAAAKAAAAAQGEKVVAYDASGNAIGGTPPQPVATPVSTAPAAK